MSPKDTCPMRSRPRAALAGALSAVLLLACQPSNEIFADFEVVPSASAPIPKPPSWVSTPAPASGSAPATSASASAPPAASGSASAAGSAPAAGSSSAAAKPAKVWDCGDKGKPDCPMQRWMKGVAGGAVASGDNDRLARAFQAMSKAPPGMGGWAGICATGAARAQAGDFDGAKAQCKVCHQKYQGAYHSSMRDMKWP